MTTTPKAWLGKRAKRAARREGGYSVEKALEIVGAAAKDIKAMAKAAMVKHPTVSAANKARAAEADDFARSVMVTIRGLEEQGHSLRGVAQWLNDLGVETRTGAAWSAKTVRDIKLRVAALDPVEPVKVVEPVEPADEDPLAEYRADVAKRIKGIFPKQAKAIAGVLNRAGLLDPDTGEDWTAEAVEPYMK